MRYNKRTILIIIATFILLYFIPSMVGGYSYSEEAAIKKSFPFKGGEIVFEEEFGNRTVVIWDTGKSKYVKLIARRLGVLYRVEATSDINPVFLDDMFGITWSASLSKNKRYDTIMGVEVFDDRISQIIVSNDSNLDKIKSKEEIKKYSSLYIEMAVKNGYTASYANLSIRDTGDFVFWGVDAEGHIIAMKP